MKYYIINEKDVGSLRERVKLTQDHWFFKWGPELVERIENNPVKCGYEGGDNCPAGVLLGEDAKRFHEYVNTPPKPMSEEAKATVRRAREIAIRTATTMKDERDAMRTLLAEMEWRLGHTDYEDSWAVMTYACPCCLNARKDGHKPGCALKKFIDGKESKNRYESNYIENL